MDSGIIRKEIIDTLQRQGFRYKNGELSFRNPTKIRLRKLNSMATQHLIEKGKTLIEQNEKALLYDFIADGKEIKPSDINPRLVMVKSDEQATLFRWVKLHWSIPISAGYGRRLRYLVMDESNDKLIGIIGLADPVFALKDRDTYIGWNNNTKADNLKCMMDGFVIGAVPPYNLLLGGKLVASLVSSKKIYQDFRKKYYNTRAIISHKLFKKNLTAITTTSAYGRSSMYDRIKIPEGSEYIHAGWTSGSGEFQFLNGSYQKLYNFANNLEVSGKKKEWGTGIRNRRVAVSSVLRNVGLSQDLLYHGIKREIFIVPFGENWKEYLLGQDKRLRLFKKKEVKDISEYMISRWILPRAERRTDYVYFKRQQYSLSNRLLI